MNWDRDAILKQIELDPLKALEDYDLEGPAWKNDLLSIPAHMHAGFVRYYLLGIPPGTFLTAVLKNDFRTAVLSADHDNREYLREWGLLLFNMPYIALDMNFWVRRGGYIGMEETDDGPVGSDDPA